MKTFLLLSIIFSITIFTAHSRRSQQRQFAQWQGKHGIRMADYQARYRSKVFQKNKAKIEGHNNDPTQTYQQGVNQYTAYSQQEFELLFLGVVPPNFQVQIQVPSSLTTAAPQSPPLVGATIPINWTAKGKVSSVKSQGNCGSCWAFSAVGALESANLIQNNRTVSLSVQQLVDCSGNYGNYGCNGGWPAYAFNYIINQNITTEALYPYTAAASQRCKGNGGGYRVSNYKSPYGCSALISELASRPMTVQVDASAWASYKSGVFNGCSATVNINHAVILAGVDASNNWWIKNSWGSAYWGMKGYILLKAGNSCGICMYPGYSPYY